ncbi:MAG: response regulator [Oligoflexia bacterium]|nr:response regulator [Oligoflexia bacterium]
MTKNFVKLLVIDHDENFLENIKLALDDEFYVQAERSGKELLKLVEDFLPNVVLVSCELVDTPFLKLFDQLQERHPNVLRLVTSTDFTNIETILESLNSGQAHNYFRKPLDYNSLKRTIHSKVIGNLGGNAFSTEEHDAAYRKLGTIIEKAKQAEKLKQQSEIQLAAVEDIKKECIDQIKKVVDGSKKYKEEVATLSSTIDDLKNKDAERLQFKKHLEELEQEKNSLNKSYQEMHSKFSDQERIAAEEKKKMQNEVDQFKSNYQEALKQKNSIKKMLDDIEVSISAVPADDPMLTIAQEQKSVAGKKSILVVDDEVEIRTAIARNLSSAYTVYIAENADQGVAEFKKHQNDIGTVVTDNKMPVKSGLEFAKEIRNIDAYMPIILLTGHQEHYKVIAAMNAGNINNYFQKPCPSKQLKEEIDGVMESYRKRLSEKSLVKGSAGSLERIQNLLTTLENLKLINKKLKEQNQDLDQKQQQMLSSTTELRNKIVELETSVPKEREAMRAQMKQQLEDFEQEMQEKERKLLNELEEKKKILTEENRKEIERINCALMQEKELAQKEQEQFKKELESMKSEFESRKTEQQQQLQREREQMIKEAEAEVNKTKQDMILMKTTLEENFKKEVEEKKKLLSSELLKLEEQKNKAKDEMTQIRAAATWELDQLKVEVAKKEQESSNLLAQSKRLVSESEEQISLLQRQNKELEQEFSKVLSERDKLMKECHAIKESMDLVVQSREAIQEELVQLKIAK